MATEPASTRSAEEELELMRRVRASDEAALAALMERWEVPVKSVIARLVFNARDAEELAQETFVRVWQYRERYEPGRPGKPWLLGIAVNLARNRLRWWRRRPAISLEEWTETPEAAGATTPEGKAALERAERAVAVREAIAELPTDLREALVLFEYEEMSQADIATALGVTVKTVETRIARARTKLKASLERWWRQD